MIRVHVRHIWRIVHGRANVHEIIGIQVIGHFVRIEQFIFLIMSIGLLVDYQFMAIEGIVVDLLR